MGVGAGEEDLNVFDVAVVLVFDCKFYVDRLLPFAWTWEEIVQITVEYLGEDTA